MNLDPITLEVIRSRLTEVAASMEHQLFHSGYSPVLRESADGSAAILDRHGRVVVGTGFPIHLFPYFYLGRTILELHGTALQPGEAYLLNDPYLSGNFHVPDTAILAPFFVGGELAGFCASIAHKPDMGGSIPGSCSPSAKDVFQEGMVFPGVRYFAGGAFSRDIEAILRRNSRAPDEVVGDMRAQVGCTQLGIDRLQPIFERYGAEGMQQAFESLIQRSAGAVAAGLARWPDGEAEAEATLDHASAPGGQARLHVRLIKRGERMTIDYSGSAAQIQAPINLRPQAAETAAVLALIPFIDASIAINDGCRRQLDFVNPEGRITHAAFPAPINSYYGIMTLLYSCVQRALATFAPGGSVASVGLGAGGCSVGYPRARSGSAGVQYEIIMSALGGHAGGDGEFQVQPMSHITPTQPIEILETEYPLRVLRFEPLRDSAGPGRNRGGPGYLRAYRFLDACQFNLKMLPYPHGGWGVQGGGSSSPARFRLRRASGEEQMLASLTSIDVKPGDEVWLEMPGGGGWGNPREREAARVQRDLDDGLVSPQQARDIYGLGNP
jgi:N-methylhydantoinase B